MVSLYSGVHNKKTTIDDWEGRFRCSTCGIRPMSVKTLITNDHFNIEDPQIRAYCDWCKQTAQIPKDRIPVEIISHLFPKGD